MVEAVLGIKKWGGNLGVRLPASVVKAAGLRLDQLVAVRVEEQRVVITPLPVEEPTLEERLARFDPLRHGGEAMAVEAVGAEKW